MKLNIHNTIDEVLQNLALHFIDSANASIGTRGRFSIALSGGSSPEKLYALLASPAFNTKVEWSKIYFFFGDERYVPLNDDQSNFKMVDRVLFQPLQIDQSKIFAVNTTLQPDEAATDYMQKITAHFMEEEPRFDLVLLGLGDNSHTASLFPHTTILHETAATIKAVLIPEQQVYRISFTAPLINLARRISFLVYGGGKAQAVANILEGDYDIENFPAQLIVPQEGEVKWFLDKAAAASLENNDD